MSQHSPTPDDELEESAQGHDLFRAPGEGLQLDQARDQAKASGWLPPDVVFEAPSEDTLRRIVHRRQDLYDSMQRLEAYAARASGQDDWAERLREAFVSLESALRRHVDEIEAPDGLFVDVVDRAPHLASDVEVLRKEHGSMIKACESTLETMSRPGEAAPGEIRRKVIGILGRLAIHRQRGSELLFDAYNVDLAAAD